MTPPTLDFATYLRSLGVMSTEEAERLDVLTKSRYCLVRVDGHGERWRCKRCNNKHSYFTLFCIERPWRGIEQGIYAYWRNVGAGNPRHLSPRQSARMDAASAFLGSAQPSLATVHPRTAHALGATAADTDIGADLLGSIEPISETKARMLADLINFKARQIMVRL